MEKIGSATGFPGLSLEDVNDLAAQHNVQSRFLPSQLTAIGGYEANEDMKLDVAH
jgi:hypothetical protein